MCGMATMKEVLDDMFDEADRNAENSVSFIERAKELERQGVIEELEELLDGLTIEELKEIRNFIS